MSVVAHKLPTGIPTDSETCIIKNRNLSHPPPPLSLSLSHTHTYVRTSTHTHKHSRSHAHSLCSSRRGKSGGQPSTPESACVGRQGNRAVVLIEYWERCSSSLALFHSLSLWLQPTGFGATAAGIGGVVCYILIDCRDESALWHFAINSCTIISPSHHLSVWRLRPARVWQWKFQCWCAWPRMFTACLDTVFVVVMCSMQTYWGFQGVWWLFRVPKT